MKKPAIIILVIIVAIVLCCCMLITFGLLGYTILAPQSTEVVQPTAAVETVTPPNLSSEPFPAPQEVPQEGLQKADAMLAELEQVEVPISNLYDLAARIRGEKDIPLTLPAPLVPYMLNDTQSFWITNTDTNESFQTTASLKYITPHLYFWIENGVRYDTNDLARLAETFESKIYPTDREFFGSEWTPGVDNDSRLYILLATNAGSNLAGYFSSADEYNPAVHEYSNAHELFLLNADNLDLSEEFTYGVLAHEFQHMIHWYRDLNEETWMNEGFSELAAYINGYDVGGFDSSYLASPDLQLTDWGVGVGDNSGHYGASFLFVKYFLDRFGEDATKALVAEDNNGMVSIDKVLTDMNAVDPATNRAITADDLFADWAVTNYINDAAAGDGRFVYKDYSPIFPAAISAEINNCPAGNYSDTVQQYGVDYILVSCPGDHTITFQGQPTTTLLETGSYSGDYSFWSNKGDESDMSLTREFDLTAVSSPVTLKYQTWYDLEVDYDYAYVMASTDGQKWDILKTPSGTIEDISGNSFGWGYNGQTNGWIEETVDLSEYAGEKVQIRFEYITDAAVNGEGLLVDDIQIPELNYFEDFEAGDGGWIGAGFVRVYNKLPQTYRVSMIQFGSGGISVTPLELDQDNRVSLPVTIQDGESLMLVVSGTTRFTRQPAPYNLAIE